MVHFTIMPMYIFLFLFSMCLSSHLHYDCHYRERHLLAENQEKTKACAVGITNEVQLPHSVSLGYRKKNSQNINYKCKGTLISFQHVLTTAHCVRAHTINEQLVQVKIGPKNEDDLSSAVSYFGVESFVIHPNYSVNAFYHDIAVIKLDAPIPVTSKYQPYCLQSQPIENMQELLKTSWVTTGWGARNFENISNVVPRIRTHRIVPKHECEEDFKGTHGLPEGIDSSMICVLDNKNEVVGEDYFACSGDSGVPLILHTGTMERVLGILSFGKMCGLPIPSVYMSTMSHLCWIEDALEMHKTNQS